MSSIKHITANGTTYDIGDGVLETPVTIDGVSFDGSTNILHYGVCSTGASTAAKTVSVTGFVLAAGARVEVKFTNENTAASPTLNVSDTGAKSIAAMTAWKAGVTVAFVYDGTKWIPVSGIEVDDIFSRLGNLSLGADGLTPDNVPSTTGYYLSATTVTEAYTGVSQRGIFTVYSSDGGTIYLQTFVLEDGSVFVRYGNTGDFVVYAGSKTGRMFYTASPTATVSGASDSSGGVMNLYLPYADGKHIRVAFMHGTRSDYDGTGTPTYHNENVYRLEQGAIGSFSGSTFTSDSTFVVSGAWEAAVYKNDAGSAVGTFHGWEKFSRCLIQVDGETIADLTPAAPNLPSVSLTEALNIDILYWSEIYELPSAGVTTETKLLDAFRRYHISGGTITVTQRNVWAQAGTHREYVGMGCFSKALTDRAICDYDYTLYDVSNQNATAISGLSNAKPHVSYAKEFGMTSGASGTIVVEPPCDFYVNNTVQDAAYNKLYFSVVKPVAVGDEWRNTATFMFGSSSEKEARNYVEKNFSATVGNLPEFGTDGVLLDSGISADDAALQDGYYAGLTAGAAETLTGRGDGVPAEFTFRTSGGGADVADGTATIQALKGNTICWNQLVENGNFASTDSWAVTNGSLSASGNILTITVTEDGNVTLSKTSGHRFDVVAGRKYFVFVRATSPRTANSYVYLAGTTGANAAAVSWVANTEVTFAYIITADTAVANNGQCLGIRFGGSGVFTVGDEITVRAAMVFDLSAMFGAGNEPTAEQFRALFPMDFYTQTDPTPLHYNGTGIQTIGFNAWDGEWESGTISSTTGAESPNSSTVRSKNYIPVIPGQTYYIYHEGGTTSPDTKLYPRCYDAEKKYLGTGSGNISTNAGTWTMPANCCYLRFVIQNTTTLSENEVTINLSWSGYRNGEQEDYWINTRALPVSSYFPTGMKSAGLVYDELRADKAITRIASVDMGDLTWDVTTIYTNPVFWANLPATAAQGRNAVAQGYAWDPDSTFDTIPDKTGYGYSYNDNARIAIRDDNYATKEAFAAAVVGKKIFFEVAAPTQTAIDPPLNLSYKVSDYGTERSLPDNTATPTTSPLLADIIYGLNVQDTVRRLPINYISKDSFDALASELSTTIGVAITATYNATTESYNFTIADNRPLQIVSAPSSSTDAGTKGNIAIGTNYLYICIQTGDAGNAVWKRVALSTW